MNSKSVAGVERAEQLVILQVKSLAIFILVAFCLAQTLFATKVSAQTAVPNGVGEYIEFGKPSLVIKLDTTVPTSDAREAVTLDSQKRLSFRLVEDRTIRSWTQIWIQNLSINSPPDALKKHTNDLIAMTRAIPTSLKQGDLIEFERAADDLTLMMLNRVEVADFEGSGFFEFLLSAFIGPIPPSSELKAALLAAGSLDISASTLFDSYGYTDERSSQIAALISDAADDVIEQIASAPETSGSNNDVAPEAAPEQEIEVAVEDVAAVEPEITLDAEEPSTAPAEVANANEVAVVEPEPKPEPAPEILEPEPEPEPVLITAESLLAIQTYQREMLGKIYRELKYPSSAQRRDQEGSLRVSVSVNMDGSLDGVSLVKQAEYNSLNKAAIAAVNDAAPFSELPNTIASAPMVVEIPIQFKLQ